MKKTVLLGLTAWGLLMGGCATQNNQANKASADTTSKNANALTVGKIISNESMNPDVAYKVANKKAKFYRSLKEYGTEDGVVSDNETAQGAFFGSVRKVKTATGTYYHVFRYYANGFNNKSNFEGSAGYKEDADYGYVKAANMKRVKTIMSEWTYKSKQLYYVGNPYAYRIWSNPVNTKHYVYITHVFDRLTTTQLYATKEMIKSNGDHYVYLKTAKRSLGWVYKSPKALIAGRYKGLGHQLLKPRGKEKMVLKVQSKRSTGNRVDANDSSALPQKVYLIKNGRQHRLRVLTVGMDNRPIRFDFYRGVASRVNAYEYWRKPWKTISSQKKLRSHFTITHEFSEPTYTNIHFFSKKSKKLVRVKTYGIDSQGTTWIYRNGQVKFKTHIDHDVTTYPISDFN